MNKMTRDLMKNQKCSYNIAYQQVVSLMANSNPGIAKFVNEKSSYSILSTENSRELAFLYAQPHDVASVLSNWGDILIYSIWTSHDGWVKGINIFNGDR